MIYLFKEEELQQVNDFWVSTSDKLLILAKLAEIYSFVVCSSDAVERLFIYFKKTFRRRQAEFKRKYD